MDFSYRGYQIVRFRNVALSQIVRIFDICNILLVYFSLTSRAFSWLNNQEGGGKEAKEDAKMKNSIVQIGKGDISRPNDLFGFIVCCEETFIILTASKFSNTFIMSV